MNRTDLTAAPTTIPVTFRRSGTGYELTSIRTGKGLGLIIASAADAGWALRRLCNKLGEGFTVQAMPGALVQARDFDHDEWAALEITS